MEVQADDTRGNAASLAGVVGGVGQITQLRCKVCSEVEVSEYLLVPKVDGLFKHAGYGEGAARQILLP